MKRALITGILGQDGTYLAERLNKLGYKVFGLCRHPSLDSEREYNAELIFGDVRDVVAINSAIKKSEPDEIYNLAGQVFVPTSWSCPIETMDVNTNTLLRIIGAVERLGLKEKTRIYQASSSEMFGNATTNRIGDERTPMVPESPYGVSKLAAHELCRVYRGKGFYCVSGICFNHESPLRGAEMVTQKIATAVAAWSLGLDSWVLKLGNIDAVRDWGFAGDYVKAMHLMMSQPWKAAYDYVIATGDAHSVEQFLRAAVTYAGFPEHLGDKFYDEKLVIGEPSLLRTNEVTSLKGNSQAILHELGWLPRTSFTQLVQMMVDGAREKLKRSQHANELSSPHQSASGSNGN
jgi:GDPmannose 4,6-dehydratase